MSALRMAADAVEAEAMETRRQIEAERSDGFNKLALLAEFTALLKVSRALRSASAIETQRATTEGRGPQDESAVAKPDAHTSSHKDSNP